MKAIRIHAYGDAKVLTYEEASQPAPTDNQVLVQIHAAGVNPFDWKVRAGMLKDWIPHSFPFIPGVDFSGVVTGVGRKVEHLSIGEAVFGEADVMGSDGSYAEFTVVTPDRLARKPRSLDHVEAASLPVAATTAWQALFAEDCINLMRGQTVLIHGGAGGVGSIAIQLAKWRRAHVVATSSAANLAFLRELGAEQVIDYGSVAFDTVVKDVDAVLDTVGGETQARSWSVLKRGGVLASIRSEPSSVQAAAHGARGVQVDGGLGIPALGRIADLVDAGALKPHVSTVLPLAEARRAHELSETGHMRGKIVLRITG